MSSKVLRSEPQSLEPMQWMSLTGSGPVVAGQEGFPRMPMGGHAEQSTVAEVEAAFQQRIREIEQEIERRAQEGFQNGLRQGQAEGQKAALAQLDGEIQRLGRTVAELAGLRHAVRRDTEEEMVRLSLAVARRIIHRELTIDPEALSGLVRAALEKIELRELYRVRTHPAHAPTVAKCLQQIGAPQKVEVDGDPSLEKGAAIFETSRGDLDASVETQLAEIQRGFADLMGKS